MIPRWISIIILILVIIWILSDPSTAGSDVHRWVNDIFTFFSHTTKG